MTKKKKINFLNIIKSNFFKFRNKTFLVSDQKSYSYYEFYELCIKFRNYLINNSKDKCPVVCIYETKKFFDYVAMIGTLMAGGHYVPINKQTPKEKIKLIISSTEANFFSSADLCDSILKKVNIKLHAISPKKIEKIEKKKNKNYQNSNIAYILFTSGTTGKPKGVIISKKNLNYYLSWLINFSKLNSKDNVSQFISISFDVSVCDFYLAICKGSKLFVPNRIDILFPARMIKENNISYLVCTPSLIDHIDNSKELNSINFKNVRTIFFCGEPLFENQVKKIFEANKRIKIVNAYGPTETTVSVTYCVINYKNFRALSKNTLSIGKTIKNSRIILVDEKLNKNDHEGEILISGKQLSKGYLKQDKETKKKFIYLNKIRYFRTGDSAEFYRKNLYFVKRIDDQIKFRGHRVELNEINHYLRMFGFNNVFTCVHKDQIISFIQNIKVSEDKIKKYLRTKIEEYKIPSNFIFLKKFPLNKSGKVDTKIVKLIPR